MATMASIVGAKSDSLMPVMAILEHDDPLFRDTPSSTTALESQKNFFFFRTGLAENFENHKSSMGLGA